jgi:hypothetical protein
LKVQWKTTINEQDMCKMQQKHARVWSNSFCVMVMDLIPFFSFIFWMYNFRVLNAFLFWTLNFFLICVFAYLVKVWLLVVCICSYSKFKSQSFKAFYLNCFLIFSFSFEISLFFPSHQVSFVLQVCF